MHTYSLSNISGARLAVTGMVLRDDASDNTPDLHLAVEQALARADFSNAGYPPERVGVFMSLPSDYAAAGRICRRHGFTGPSCTIEATCSPSLAVLYNAFVLIRSSILDAAVIGGVKEACSPLPHTESAACAPKDVAVILLEREDLARRRQTEIFGLVSACVCRSHAPSPTTNATDALARIMLASFADLPYGPAEIDIVACHAVGTRQTVKEELPALRSVYAASDAKGPVFAAFRAQGAQAEHRNVASGLFALIPGLLAMRHATFPGAPVCTAPDDESGEHSGLRMSSAPQLWPMPTSGIRRFQVNDFAAGASCVIAQLEEENALSALRGKKAFSTSAESVLRETEIHGVSLLTISHQGQAWRLGSINMGWRQELSGMPPEPKPEDLAVLAKRGVWLHRAEQPPPLALVCCGQGSVYPGMGRELYDFFPPAREAMDRLAAKADWDLLGLMDEKDMEKIILTRWQQPYLFLLEYAQFHYLQSMGLRPSVIAGHSLGELIALCLAGAYTPEGAWHILDGRSKVMEELEKSAQRDTGMMAVHAPQSTIDACLAEFPSLLVSNYNTPTQFILSGPKTDLRTASRALRKRRIPAMQLNVSLAFHHPGMRVVREFSLNGLRDVPMRDTHTPMLSNVTTGLYPDDAEGIREYILNLDENPVRWVECVHVMRKHFKVRHFLELGPADTLCGLIGDILPEALCISAGRKGREAENLRTATARLYALGHLPNACLSAQPRSFSMYAPQPALVPFRRQTAAPPNSAPLSTENTPAHVEEFMAILVETTSFTRQELHPDMDLRHDLALRSSRFPLIMHEVETRFGLALHFDDLLGVASIREMAERILHLRQTRKHRNNTGADAETHEEAKGRKSPPGKAEEALPPLVRYGFRHMPFIPPDGQLLSAQRLLVAGKNRLAPSTLAFLRSRYGNDRVTYCPEPAEALDAASQDAFDVLALLPESDYSQPTVPGNELRCFFLLLQAFLRHEEARFCLLAGTGAEQMPDATQQGITGIMLAAALEYPSLTFRSIRHCRDGSEAPEPERWLAPALVQDSTPGQTPLQWFWNDGVWRGLQIMPLPFNPALGEDNEKRLHPGDVLVVSCDAQGIIPHVLRECAMLGCKIALLEHARSPRNDRTGALDELARLGAPVEYHVCDLSDAAAVRRILSDIHAARGRIDGVIHAAGATQNTRIESLSPELFTNSSRIKCDGVLHLVREALPLGLRYVAAFSSIASAYGAPGQADDCAASQSMHALLRGLCGERLAMHLLWLPPVSHLDGSTNTGEYPRPSRMDKTFCSADELSCLLVRELACAHETDVLLTRDLPETPTLLPAIPAHTKPEQLSLAPLSENFPLLLPDACALGEEAALDARCHFSQFRNPWIAGARTRPDSQFSCLPPSIQLAALMEGATQLFPWLAPAGAEELFFSTVDWPPGITREGHVRCRALRVQAGPRQCQSELLLRELAPNGRARRSYSPTCSARVTLMPEAPTMLTPLLPDPAFIPVSTPAMSAGQDTLQNFYKRQTGLWPEFRLLTDVYALEEKRLLARMRIPSETDIVGLKNSRYIYPVSIFEAASQAVLLLALNRFSMQNGTLRLTLSRIAAVNFLINCLPHEAFGLEAREDVNEPRGMRFNVELRDARGRVVFSLRGMQLETELQEKSKEKA